MIALLALAAMSQPLCAATASTTFNVTLTVVKECTISAPSAINFGTVGSTNLMTIASQQSQSFSVLCSTGTPYTVAFTSANDLVANGTVHQMKGAVAANLGAVPYTLTETTSGATNVLPLGGTASVITSVGTGSSQTKLLQATTLPLAVALQPDTYTDTVTMAVTY